MAADSGYFDLQVNGYAGVDFNGDDLSEDDLVTACARLRQDGVAGILATVISDQLDAMCRRLRRIMEISERYADVRRMIWGVHIEGPFLNEAPGYVGAHPVDAMRPADPESMRQLLDAAGGLTRLVTLAPERDPGLQVTRLLADQSVVVSAGHCDATTDQLRAAIDAGLTMFTHLGNGCPLLMHRHDNIIQRVLSLADKLWIGFIADGVHVPFVALGNYLKLAGPGRAIVVTDAIAAAGMGPGVHQLAGRQVVVDEHLATWAEDRSHLVGSAMTMPQAVENLRAKLGYDEDTIVKVASENPRMAMGINQR